MKLRSPVADLPDLGQMMETGQALAIPDTNAYPGWVSFPEVAWIRSHVAAPILLKEQIIGFLKLDSATPNFFTAAHAARLQAFADQAAIALENARLLAASQRRAKELTALYRAGQQLQQLHTPETLAQELIRVLEEVLAYEFGAVLLLDEATGRLLPFALSEQGHGPAFVEADKAYVAAHDLRPGQGITGWVAQTGQSICLGDVRQDPRYLPMRDNIRSELCAPLYAGNQIIGVVNVETSRLNAYTPADQRLLETVAAQIAVAIQNTRLYGQVQAGRERLEALSHRLLAAQETERRRLARELHDEIGQTLSMVKIDLQAMQHLAAAAALEAYLVESIAIVERALQQVRSLSVELRPSLLDDLGLVPALRWYIDRQAQRAGLVANFVADSLAARLPAELETACFRVAQEALTNVLRYAQARRLEVELRRHEAELELVIRDDGVGFDVPAALARATGGASLGLLGMQERALLVGGQLEIESRLGQGTEIRASFPLKGD
jgi:signal transduction histidine kinase